MFKMLKCLKVEAVKQTHGIMGIRDIAHLILLTNLSPQGHGERARGGRTCGRRQVPGPEHAGLRLGWPLSPDLLTIFLDRISEPSQGPEGTTGSDGLVLLASSHQDLRHVTRWVAAARGGCPLQAGGGVLPLVELSGGPAHE